ncbi:hypothetical protein [Chthonobacter albigriseus]|uniref:hypothetical protein n=1 Tax=Chthonobacter albigriseus TaxID=1683161 RepID=UPI0015EFD445|nr:hypothetical protein [Chthonobacter albigriseus]
MARAIRPDEYLIVSPDDETRFFAETLLEESGLKVRSFGAAKACRSHLSSHAAQVAMVFVDLAALTRSDSDLMESIGSDFPWIQLVSTGTADELSRVRGDALRMTKPWLPIELLIAAERARAASAP